MTQTLDPQTQTETRTTPQGTVDGWLASLEFEAAGLVPRAVHRCADGRPVWLYQVPFKARSARS